jgi:beta-lactamase regulating signal transducer with metallopeptidase domain
MMLPFYLRAIAEATASGILICVAGGIPIALFAWILLRVFGRQESGTRFAVCFSALLAIALLPAFERLRTAAPNVGSGPGNSLITISSSWAAIIFALWALFATIGLARVVLGFLKLQRLRASCTALNSTSVNPILQETLREFDSARLVRICVSDGLRVPTAIGFLKPMVILPSWALNELSPSELRAVLLHELAHLKRWDDWTNLVQKLIQAALFFHPAVWWIENRLSLEREMACDDIVLAHTENPRAYAQCLLSIAEKSFMRRGFSLAQAVVNRMRQTSLRISQILDSKRSGTIGAWKPTLLLAAFSMLAFAAVPQMPQLVAFREDPNPVASAANSNLPATSREKLIQASATKPVSPRPAVRVASIQTKFAFSHAKNGSQSSPNRVIETRFSSAAGSAPQLQGKNTSNYGDASFIQTVFVITRTQQDEGSAELWTIHVWQLTVYKTSTVAGSNPTKKV